LQTLLEVIGAETFIPESVSEEELSSIRQGEILQKTVENHDART
jgi:hypothetical protein